MQQIQEEINKENQIPAQIYTVEKGLRNVIPQFALQGWKLAGHSTYPFYKGVHSYRLVLYYSKEGLTDIKKVSYNYNQDTRYFQYDGINSTGSGAAAFQASDLDSQTRTYFGI